MIALAIVLGLVDGCPLPEPGYVSPRQKPIVDVVRPVQHAVLAPVRWVTRMFRFSQRWALFQVAPRETYRLDVEGQRDNQWELVFRAGDPEHDEYRALLFTDRVRGAWYPAAHPAHQFGPFSEWFLGKVLADHPEYRAARLRFEKVVLAPEDGEVRGTGWYVMPMERAR